MKLYCDTSFLFSVYVADQNSPRALAFLDRASGPLPFTQINRMELRHAVRLAAFRSNMDEQTCAGVLRHIKDDLQDGTLVHIPIEWTELLQQFEIISETCTAQFGPRTLDVLQVAAAVTIGADRLLTFDKNQSELARRVGLNVWP